MSRVCDITGQTKSFGNKVSHSNRKTKRTYLVNLHNVTLFSDVLNRKFRFKISSRTLRTIDYKGGLDLYLLETSSRKLSDKAQKIKKMIKKATAENAKVSL
ncbi:50S ribosomal protein L28 [Ehrlichia ruminantium]|uniref:Large ribosomal subunit protein bL28 n=1 Tax=Ehrlichia ruminantium (strain Welgevonden) TaxID=254945 RepID=RL28_EHRRW|nr:50S ribosomal protein L28 [Ehrlichia ruminantium]Q5HAZ6.1 RecName: Full=Large ribosomal subunit protein bL28; AltName: Full=50S ribosomal protein L28 [Ehrlichia ruminantium str. Welgevonden]KYW99718.1 50S ribosomal protein L28 [Ehrlichia ruminantium]QLK50613.1 50S ribosomal protein L28 [Ehrlichia ruminantium]QLK51538.1 50S ribosomal protein L28 [Ehrlichia ruminantium]QLK53373.1 50S ribosomal protein L28 [Ehrlichia ruminantium]QLK55213.1 50S ribosomal protein L28 [Ehrlichia ruminantium]